MKLCFITLFFSSVLSIQSLAEVKSESKSSNKIVIMTYDKLMKLNPKQREQYIRSLAQLLGSMKSRRFVGNNLSVDKEVSELIKLLIPFAHADDLGDVRFSGNPCIYAGSVSSYPEGTRGTVRCSPPSSVRFCGRTYSCGAGRVPCNPLLFGFSENNYANYFSGRSVRIDGNRFLVSVVNPSQGLDIRDQEIYSNPICIDERHDATRECDRVAGGTKAHYYGVGYMLADFKAKPCDVKSEWNTFAEQAGGICDVINNALQAHLSDEESECTVIAERSRLLTLEYRESDVGNQLDLNDYKNVR